MEVVDFDLGIGVVELDDFVVVEDVFEVVGVVEFGVGVLGMFDEVFGGEFGGVVVVVCEVVVVEV